MRPTREDKAARLGFKLGCNHAIETAQSIIFDRWCKSTDDEGFRDQGLLKAHEIINDVRLDLRQRAQRDEIPEWDSLIDLLGGDRDG
jgi:hypothetical protein